MTSLPDSYFASLAALSVMLAYGTVNIRQAWALPFNGVLFMIGAWYMVEPLYFEDFFWAIKTIYLPAAFDAVLIFLLSFSFFTAPMVRWFRPPKRSLVQGKAPVSAESVLMCVLGLWLALLAYGTVRMEGNIFGALFPIDGRTGVNMWSRAAGAGAGAESFLVSTASYLYLVCLSAFGILIVLLPAGHYRQLAVLLILVSWPYVVLQGSRNLLLAATTPAIFAYILYGRHSPVFKTIIIAVIGMALELVLRIMIQYRNIGFSTVQLGDVKGTQHLGLNMASELVFCIEYISEGILPVKYGAGYLAELANVVPRVIWSDKPLVGVDYALARGFASTDLDIGVFATLSTGVIGGAVLNFGTLLGPFVGGLIMSAWVGLLTRFRLQGTSLRQILFLVGLGLTFNLGRDITLLVLWPIVLGYLAVRLVEWRSTRPASVPKGLSSRVSNADPNHFTQSASKLRQGSGGRR